MESNGKKGTHMKFIIFSFAFLGLLLPVRSETFLFDGTSSAEVVIKREGEYCETGVAEKCKSNQPCFINMFIRGEAAKALYDALKMHGIKTWHGFELEYVGTASNRLTCYGSERSDYFCSFGYDAMSNQLSETKTCRSH